VKPLNVISFLVENKPGVLFNISNNFRRKGFNIHSITAIAGEDPDTTRITITVRGEAQEITKLVEQLDKMVDVVKVKSNTPLKIEFMPSSDLPKSSKSRFCKKP
jgi:acetolactate synthase small subunit